jgi:hypothetical protein
MHDGQFVEFGLPIGTEGTPPCLLQFPALCNTFHPPVTNKSKNKKISNRRQFYHMEKDYCSYHVLALVNAMFVGNGVFKAGLLDSGRGPRYPHCYRQSRNK